MGFKYKNICFSTQADATDNYFQDLSFQQVAAATTLWNRFEFDGAVWRHKQYSTSSLGVTTTKWNAVAGIVNFPQCDNTTQFTDGLQLGWGVVAAIVGAWGVRLLMRQLGVRT